MLFLAATAHLDVAEPAGVLDHHPAALPAPRAVGRERCAHRIGAGEFFGQHDRVFDADAGACRQVRRGGVHRVADQHHAAVVPGLRHQQALERAKDDLGVVADLRPHRLHQRRGERGQQVGQPLCELRRIDALVGGAVFGDEEVHLLARDRVHAGLHLRAEPHGGALHVGGPRQHRAPHRLPGVARHRRVREQRLAHLRVQAVGAHHQVVALALAVGEAHVHAFGLGHDRGEGAAQPHVRAAGPCRVCQDARQHRPQDRATPRDLGPGDAWRRNAADGLAAGEEEVHAIGASAVFQERVQDTQRAKGAQRGAAQADTGAVGAPAGVYLHHVNLAAELAQLDRGRHAGEAAADDENAGVLQVHGVIASKGFSTGARQQRRPHQLAPATQ